MARQIKPEIRSLDLRTARPLQKKADPELLTPEHKAWRTAVLNRAGWQCEWITDGHRCRKSQAAGHRMIADHIVERKDGGALYDLANGRCLCVQHNTLKGLQARQRRMEERF